MSEFKPNYEVPPGETLLEEIKRRLEEVDAPFHCTHCTYYTEGEGAKKWKMVICTSAPKEEKEQDECQPATPQ